MDVRTLSMRFISNVEQYISQVSEINEYISCSTREINFILPHIVYYIKILLLSHTNRAVHCNAYHDKRYMWDYHE